MLLVKFCNVSFLHKEIKKEQIFLSIEVQIPNYLVVEGLYGRPELGPDDNQTIGLRQDVSDHF